MGSLWEISTPNARMRAVVYQWLQVHQGRCSWDFSRLRHASIRTITYLHVLSLKVARRNHIMNVRLRTPLGTPLKMMGRRAR